MEQLNKGTLRCCIGLRSTVVQVIRMFKPCASGY